MIIGIGSDLSDIRRIEAVWARHGERFLARVFTPVEQAKAKKRVNADANSNANTTMAATLAKRFAAKEACAKALGTGINRGVAFRDIGVVNLPSGQPTLELTGRAAERLAALTPPGHRARAHLSLTDDFPYAQAFVILEALPE